MLRRVISSVVLASLVAAPVAARTRFVCRYTGIEITDCAEQHVPAAAEVQKQECCDRQVTPAAGAMRASSNQELQPPVTPALPFVVADPPAPRLHERVEPRLSPRQPVYLITRALLI